MNILFVCTGNTCRSPIAEWILRQKSPNDTVSSAGIMPDADSISENSKKVLAEIGLDATEHRPKQVTQALLDKQDIVICLTRGHRRALENYFKTQNITDFYALTGNDISDPYGCDLQVYRAVRDQIAGAMDEILRYIDSLRDGSVNSV